MPMSLWKRLSIALGLLSILAAPALAEEPALNRSLYVPVRFAPCEHLENTVLYRGDEPLRELPGTQVFQFTYYPNLSRLEPQFERVRIEGEHQGVKFRSEIVVTPASVYIGKRKIELDLENQISRLKSRGGRTSRDRRSVAQVQHCLPRERGSSHVRRNVTVTVTQNGVGLPAIG